LGRISRSTVLVLALAFWVAWAPISVQAAVPADSVRPATAAVLRADTTLIIKHHFNHRQQIITGSVIMACLASIVVVMNNYNPQGFQQ
jgi:hypothetical protein